MRARLLPLSLTIVVLLLAASVTGCSGQEATPSGAPSATATVRPDAGAEGQAAFTTVDVQTAHQALDPRDSARLLDVREPEEWAETGVVPDAVLIPLAEVASRAAGELDPDRPVYVICRSGNRSQVASETLIGLGFSRVYNVAGGITAWLAAGLPVEPYRP